MTAHDELSRHHLLRIEALREATRDTSQPTDEVERRALRYEKLLAGPEAEYPPPWDDLKYLRGIFADALKAYDDDHHATPGPKDAIHVREYLPRHIVEHYIALLTPPFPSLSERAAGGQ